jgi:hypothetical protein
MVYIRSSYQSTPCSHVQEELMPYAGKPKKKAGRLAQFRKDLLYLPAVLFQVFLTPAILF